MRKYLISILRVLFALTLSGWFVIHDQELVIFNFDTSGSLVDRDIKSDSRIERILLTNFDYMD